MTGRKAEDITKVNVQVDANTEEVAAVFEAGMSTITAVVSAEVVAITG